MNIVISQPLVLFAGIIEAFIWTWHMIEVNKRHAFNSSLILCAHASLYLFIISGIISSANTIALILTYATGAAIGNYLRVKWISK